MTHTYLALSTTVVAWLSAALFAVIALALVVSLTIVNSIVEHVGGRRDSQVGHIADDLIKVAENTDPVPQIVNSINQALSELSEVMVAIEQHLAVARLVFDRVAEGQVGSPR
jgi:hypothetical protein